MIGCLTNQTWINAPTYIVENLVLVVHMDILSILSIFQILYIMMTVFSSMVSEVVVVDPYTGNG